MKAEHTFKLLGLFNAGCKIDIKTGLVDNGFELYIADEDTLEQNNGFHKSLEDGDVCFDSESYSQYPLKEISVNNVYVFKQIEDWQNADSESI